MGSWGILGQRATPQEKTRLGARGGNKGMLLVTPRWGGGGGGWGKDVKEMVGRGRGGTGWAYNKSSIPKEELNLVLRIRGSGEGLGDYLRRG